MSDLNRPGERPQTDTLPPGADRFWGQFSQTRAGRTRTEEESQPTDPGATREEGQHCLEWCPICRSADIVRATTSPEAIGQVQAIQNEALGVLKSFLAIYAERTGQAGRDPGEDDSPEPRGSREGGRKAGGPQTKGRSSDRRESPPVRDIWID
jgi:hypothetical protein